MYSWYFILDIIIGLRPIKPSSGALPIKKLYDI
jgi:hypothetical protein